MNESIEITKGTDITLTGEVTEMASLAGYTVTLTVKKAVTDEAAEITSEGTVDGLDVTFDLSNEDTDIAPGVYLFDVVAADDTKRYELATGTMVVRKGVSS